MLNNILQWVGAVFIIAGHLLNTLIEYSYDLRPYNIVAFALGTICFFAWTIRVANKPQMLVNVVALVTCTVGLLKAWA